MIGALALQEFQLGQDHLGERIGGRLQLTLEAKVVQELDDPEAEVAAGAEDSRQWSRNILLAMSSVRCACASM